LAPPHRRQWNGRSTTRKRRSTFRGAATAITADRGLHDRGDVQHQDEVDLATFIRSVADRGIHIVCAAGPEAVAAAALFGKAFKRARVGHVATTALGFGERIDSATVRAWLADAPALLVVGLQVRRSVGDMPQLWIDGDDDEPLTARAFRLGETVAMLGDATWCAALGLIGRAEPHVLVERALSRHTRADLEAVAELLDAAARGPAPAQESLNAAEMLIAAPEPRRFLASVPAEVLRRTQLVVHSELARATRVRPRPGFGVVVVEYESACHLEDLVAERWRGLRAGTVVLVANHGAVDGMVAVTARAAVREALDRLRYALSDEGTTLLDPATWEQLRQRLGVAPAAIERIGDGAFELSALPN
jgi:hypothetical protein